MRFFALILVLLAALSGAVTAQITTLNTTLSGFVPLSSSNWVADVFGWVDPATGNEYALVCRGNDGLAIVDVTNPATATVVQTISATASDLKDVRTYQNYAYCIQQGGETLIVDLTNPSTAFVVGSLPTSGGHNAFVDEGRGLLYVCRSGAGCEIWDLVPNPASPIFRALYDPPSHSCHDVYAKGNRLYSFDISSDITHIVDVTNPATPIQMATLAWGNHAGYGYTPDGGGAEILITCDEVGGGFVHVFDVTDPISTPHIGSYVTDPTSSVHNVLVHGRYAYISYYKDGLRILDMANPARPKEVGIYDWNLTNSGGLYTNCWGVYPFNENKVVVTEMFGSGIPQGMSIINFTPPRAIDLDASTTGIGDVAIDIDGLDPGAIGYLAVSLNTSGLFGTGPFLGLAGDALFSLMTGSAPFTHFANASGHYGIAVGSGIPLGLSADMRSVTFTASDGWLTSDIVRVDF